MSRLHRTRKESVEALHRALARIWHLVHNEHRDLKTIKLSEISRTFRVSTLPVALIKSFVLRESQPTLASAAKLREILSANARAKGGTRKVRQASENEVNEAPKQLQRTLFNFNNYDAVEETNRLQEILHSNGYSYSHLELIIREDSYSLKLKITKQTK